MQHVLFLLLFCQPANVSECLPSFSAANTHTDSLSPLSPVLALHLCILHSFSSTFHLPVVMFLSIHWGHSLQATFTDYLLCCPTAISSTYMQTYFAKVCFKCCLLKAAHSKKNHERSVPNLSAHGNENDFKFANLPAFPATMQVSSFLQGLPSKQS